MSREHEAPIIALGKRSVAAREIINSILVTGDHNRVFIGPYERLSHSYIDPTQVFERVQLDHFTGREWLTAEVDDFLAENDRGYFILEANAGLGKTAFLAHLVEHRSYIHHFVELARGPTGVDATLRSIAAQLVRAYQILPFQDDDVLPGAATRPDFLVKLLRRAAAQGADDSRGSARVVVVVDGLDEAGVPTGQNVLGLPESLPRGVFFIVSKRPVVVPLDTDGPRQVFRLEAESDANIADMRAYLRDVAESESVRKVLDDSKYTTSEFAETLLLKSGGVWVYLRYVLEEIKEIGRDRDRRPDEASGFELDALPEGLWRYYLKFWRRWRDSCSRSDWSLLYLPVLATLAALQEDFTVERLAALAQVPRPQELRRLLEEDWAPFLTVQQTEVRRYRPYHASFREFLEGGGEAEDRSADEDAFAREFAQANREAQQRIADRYLAAWGGLPNGLASLRDPAIRDLDGGYGLRHVPTHLISAAREGEFHGLLSAEWTDGTRRDNAWYSAHEQAGSTSMFLTHVERAWQRVAEESADQVERGERPVGIAMQARYALTIASGNSVARSIPLPLLKALVEKGTWDAAHGLTYAHQIRDPARRIRALLELSLLSRLSPEERLSALEQATSAAYLVDDEDAPDLLAELAPHLPSLF